MGGGDLSDEGIEDEKKSPVIPSTPCYRYYVLEWQDPANPELTSCSLITQLVQFFSVCDGPTSVRRNVDVVYSPPPLLHIHTRLCSTSHAINAIMSLCFSYPT
jgi:hypothetical protein